MKLLRLIKWLAIFLIAGLLIYAGIKVMEYQRAIQEWQSEVNRLNAQALLLTAQVADLEVQAESDYYRGILSSCVASGMQQSVPRDVVVSVCANFMQMAYEADWYHELTIDTWQWPPKKE